MSTYQSNISSGQGGAGVNPSSSVGKSAQQGSQEAMEFQLWVSQQATMLNKLKIFNSMAKSINDQQ